MNATQIQTTDMVRFTYNGKPRLGCVKAIETNASKLVDKRSKLFMLVDLEDGSTKNFTLSKVSGLTVYSELV